MDNTADAFVEVKEKAAQYKKDYDACTRRRVVALRLAWSSLVVLLILVLLTMLPLPHPAGMDATLGFILFGCFGLLFIYLAQSETSSQRALSREWDSWLDKKQFDLFERCLDCQQRLVELIAMDSDKQLIGQILRKAETAKHVYDTFKRVAVNLKLTPKAAIPDSEESINGELS